MDWLDVRVTEKHEVDLLGEQASRIVQFRYVEMKDTWHLGRYGKLHHSENYAPFKNDNTWQTPAAQDWRPLITACESSDRALHRDSSRVGIASPETANEICRRCLSVLSALQRELLERSPEYRRYRMVEKLLRHADEALRQKLQSQTERPDLWNEALKYFRENGPEESFQLACLADKFGLAAQ